MHHWLIARRVETEVRERYKVRSITMILEASREAQGPHGLARVRRKKTNPCHAVLMHEKPYMTYRGFVFTPALLGAYRQSPPSKVSLGPMVIVTDAA